MVITDTFDPNLNLNTFQLTEIAFGDTVLAIPPGTQDYQTTVPMTYDGVTFDVVISAVLNYAHAAVDRRRSGRSTRRRSFRRAS